MKYLFSVILISSIVLSSCGNDPLDVDVSAISVPQVKINRYDEAFFSLDTAHFQAGINQLSDKYGPFHTGYLQHVIYRSGNDSLSHDKDLKGFLLDYSTRGVYTSYLPIFKDGFADLENQLTDAFKHFKYYFPMRKTPLAVNADMSGFNYNILFIEGGYFGIGLEFYLGSQNFAYEQLQWPSYMKAHCRKEYMSSNFVQAWMMTEFPYAPPKNDLLNKMIYEGKLLYLKKALLRNTDDTLLLGFSKNQIDWCMENEAMMYSSLIEKQKIYSENAEDLQHYTEDAPFTPDFPRESPGKAGNWIGLRIIESFMEKNPKVTIEELMKIEDGQTILNRAKYKPKF